MMSIDDKNAYDMVQKILIINCLKMYKTSNQVINFIENTMKNRRGELTTGRKSLAEVKIKREIFHRDTLTPLLFLRVIMSLNHTARKCTDRCKLRKSQEKINNLIYMDDIKLFAQNEKELETLIQAVRIHSQDIGMGFVIEKCAMLIMERGKRQMKERIELQDEDKIRTLGEKETYKYLAILEADITKHAEIK